MSTKRLDAVIHEVEPGLWRGRLNGFMIQVFELDGRWVAQALTRTHGVNKWADSVQAAKLALLAWIDANPGLPDAVG